MTIKYGFFVCLILGIASTSNLLFSKPQGKSTFPSVDQLIKDENSCFEPASSELIKFAKKSADKGYNKVAEEAISFVAMLYPRDLELAKLKEAYASGANTEPTEEFQKEKDQVYAKTAKYMVKYGDNMAKTGGYLLAEWAYNIAEKMGYPADKKKLKEIEKPLEEFKTALKNITPTDKYDLMEAPKTEYQYRFKLPGSWSIEKEWPVMFVFHGTGAAWGVADDNEESTLKRRSHFASSGDWIVVSIREPLMLQGQLPGTHSAVEAMEEILAILAIRYRANPNSVSLASAASGALCCWAYLAKHPERICAVEVIMGKFKGLGIKKGSIPAINVPIRLGIQIDQNSGGAQHDQVHIEQTYAAKAMLEQLGFTKLEFVKENFQSGDKGWYSKCAEAKVKRCKSITQEKK